MEASIQYATPSWTVPARRQHGLLFESGRVWLLLVACVAPVLLMEAMRLRSIASRGPSLGDTFPVLLVVFRSFMLIAPAWALLVWRGEAWDRRPYHWSLPVTQTTHDLWRVAAGAAWLLAGAALCCITGLLLALRAGQAEVLGYGPLFWFNYVTYPLIFYLAASIFPLAARRAIEWLIGVIAAGAAVMFAGEAFGIGPIRSLIDALIDGRFGLHVAMDGGFVATTLQFGAEPPVTVAGYAAGFGDWLVATAIWLGVPLVGVVLAARRRR